MFKSFQSKKVLKKPQKAKEVKRLLNSKPSSSKAPAAAAAKSANKAKAVTTLKKAAKAKSTGYYYSSRFNE